MDCARSFQNAVVGFCLRWVSCCVYTVDIPVPDFVGQYTVTILVVHLCLPVMIVHDHRPSPEVSNPDSRTRWATSLVTMVAVPPGWYFFDNLSLVLYDTAILRFSNHLLVLSHSVWRVWTFPQLTLVSARPMTSTCCSVMYLRMSSLLSLFSIVPIPLTLTKLIRTVLVSLSVIVSPQSSLCWRRLRESSVCPLCRSSRRRRGAFCEVLHIIPGATPSGIG